MSSTSVQKGAFGRVAVELGLLTEQQVEEGLRLQAKLRGMGIEESLGEILLRKGFLTEEALREVLRVQGQRVQTRLPGLRVVAKLGAGAMGSVYKAIQLSMDRPVAIKVLNPELAQNPSFRERFLREARSTAHLRHPNIVGGIDCGVHEGLYFYVMEFVEGLTAREEIGRHGPMDEVRCLSLAIDVARGLQYAYEQGYVHRDVKPDNLLIESESRLTRITDLGLARPVTTGPTDLTAVGTTLGTASYMSPEQARGESDVDIRTDLYSLGASLFHLLSGEHLFDGRTGAQVMIQHMNQSPRDVREVRPEISKKLAQIVGRCLRKRAEDRFPTPAHLANELGRLQQRASSSSSQQVPIRKSQSVRRFRGSLLSARRRRGVGRKRPRSSTGPLVMTVVVVLLLVVLCLVWFNR